MNNIFRAVFFLYALVGPGQASANGIVLSDFYQDWQLNSDKTSSSCVVHLSGEPGENVPGVTGMPNKGYDSDQAIRFIDRDAPNSFALVTLGRNPSGDTDGDTVATLEGNELKVIDYKKFLGFSQVYRQDTYTLLSDGGLVVNSTEGKSNSVCTYSNLHPDHVNKIEVGASLFIQGKKVAQCTFVPAKPTDDQINFFYNERCTFGKYTHLILVDLFKTEVFSDLVQSPKATRDLEIVRSSQMLNAATENFISFDREWGGEDSTRDHNFQYMGEYYLSPYKKSRFNIEGTSAFIKIDYAPAR